MERVEVVVIGAGAMGSATAWWLARRGRLVTLLEQFEQGHTRGSSHGGTRIFRFAYPEPDYVRMAQAALPLWRELEADAGRTLLETTGAVDHGDAVSIEATAAALAACGARHERLTAVEAEQRWPHMRFDGPVLFHPDGGRCLAAAAVRALQDRAAAHGADVRFGTGPARLEPAGEGIIVRAGEAEWAAGVAVVTAGPWLAATLGGLVDLPPVTVTREQIQHFRPRRGADAATWPSFIHHRRPWAYGLFAAGEGMKVAEHHVGPVVDPALADGSARDDLVAGVSAYVEQWFPGLDPEPVHLARCLYTTTPTEDFVLDRRGPVVVGSPCSGHGFKFTPLVGRILADLADGRPGPGGRFALRTGGRGAVSMPMRVAGVVGGTVLAPDGPRRADVAIDAGRIAAVGDVVVGEGEGEVLDADGLLVAPGFIDLQCNGAVGIDLGREPQRLWEVAQALPRWGVTAWLPTIVTAPPAIRDRALVALRDGPPPGQARHAAALGLHLEGPFLAPARAGAHHRPLLVAPDSAEAARWSRSGGVALVTLAPELPGATAVIAGLVDRGVVVSAGHSDATAEEATAAADAGVRMVTHLFNAMAPFHHRAPGLAGVALADQRLVAGVIADGLHLHPTAVAVAAAALGDRLVLVTDAVGALGAPPGPLAVGPVEAVAGPDGVRLADGTLAGSELAMDQAVRNLCDFTGCGAEIAVGAATAVPARLLGLVDRGRIAPGAVADIVLLTPDLEVVATVCEGGVAWRS